MHASRLFGPQHPYLSLTEFAYNRSRKQLDATCAHSFTPRSDRTGCSNSTDVYFLSEMCSVRMSPETLTILAEVFRCFPQSLHTDAVTAPRLVHVRFLPDTFHFIIHQTSNHPTLHTANAYSAIEWLAKLISGFHGGNISCCSLLGNDRHCNLLGE